MKLVRASDLEWEQQWAEETEALENRLGTPIIVEDSKSQMVRQRSLLIAFTVLLVATMPALHHFFPVFNSYLLSAAMAFTIGTNLTIFIISTQIEDKADQMERKMESLLDELDRAATGLDNFHGELSSVNIPAIVDGIERAREEMKPSMERLQGVSWEQLSEAMDNLFDFWERVDKEKLNGFIDPFIASGGLVPSSGRTFDQFDEYLPDLEPLDNEEDEFMPPRNINWEGQ